MSFTFDDFPKSALDAGGAILERYGARGTYYAALGLAGRSGDMGPLFQLDDLAAAQQRGHELGCHTFSHLDCSRAAGAVIANDVAENAAAFGRWLDGFSPTQFAYPFGALSLSARRRLAGHFRSCRGIMPGINSGIADLGHLRSQRLYAGDFNAASLRELIERNRALGGWLIFYTHDVAPQPSPFGCTPEQFEEVVAHAAATGEVLPVGQVVARL